MESFKDFNNNKTFSGNKYHKGDAINSIHDLTYSIISKVETRNGYFQYEVESYDGKPLGIIPEEDVVDTIIYSLPKK